MKQIFYSTFIAAGLSVFGLNAQAQTTENRDEKIESKKEVEQPRPETKTEPIKEAERNMEKAAESIQRSAEKIKVVVEDRADRIAKVSQPAIESFLVASSNLIEKIAAELEKMVNEKPVKKSSQ